MDAATADVIGEAPIAGGNPADAAVIPAEDERQASSASGGERRLLKLRRFEHQRRPDERATRKGQRANQTWLSVESAARIVDMHPTTFRRQLERNVYRADDGGTESRFDGIVARKLGGRWKVLLGPRWLNPLSTEGEDNNGVRATSSSARPEHTGRSGK